MTPDSVNKARARMRQAYTEACVKFPSLNVTPVQLALYQNYQDVAYFVGSTYVLMDPAIGGEILGLTMEAQTTLLAKEHLSLLLMNVATVEHKKYRSMLTGLDTALGSILLSQIRDGTTQSRLKVVRTTMLQNRRNLLANALSDKAVRMAQERFKNSPHGEEVTDTRAEFGSE